MTYPVVFVSDSADLRELIPSLWSIKGKIQGDPEVKVFAHPSEAADYIAKNPCSVLVIDNNYETEQSVTDKLIAKEGFNFGFGEGVDRGLGVKVARTIAQESHILGVKIHPKNKNMVVILFTADPTGIPRGSSGIFSVMNAADNSKVRNLQLNEAVKEHTLLSEPKSPSINL